MSFEPPSLPPSKAPIVVKTTANQAITLSSFTDEDTRLRTDSDGFRAQSMSRAGVANRPVAVRLAGKSGFEIRDNRS